MSEPQLPREVRRRLAIIRHAEEVTGNVAMTCRYYGISRQVYYRWLRRYQEQGIDGLRDLSRRPHHSPNATVQSSSQRVSGSPRQPGAKPARLERRQQRGRDCQRSPKASDLGSFVLIRPLTELLQIDKLYAATPGPEVIN
jgi:transposase-like protein